MRLQIYTNDMRQSCDKLSTSAICAACGDDGVEDMKQLDWLAISTGTHGCFFVVNTLYYGQFATSD